jgi:hypothetical protein
VLLRRAVHRRSVICGDTNRIQRLRALPRDRCRASLETRQRPALRGHRARPDARQVLLDVLKRHLSTHELRDVLLDVLPRHTELRCEARDHGLRVFHTDVVALQRQVENALLTRGVLRFVGHLRQGDARADDARRDTTERDDVVQLRDAPLETIREGEDVPLDRGEHALGFRLRGTQPSTQSALIEFRVQNRSSECSIHEWMVTAIFRKLNPINTVEHEGYANQLCSACADPRSRRNLFYNRGDMSQPATASLNSTWDGYAQFNYDYVRTQQPHLEVSGLFKIDNHYFIVCKNLSPDLLAIDGTPILKWICNNVTAGLWLEAVETPPENAHPVAERSQIEFINLVGKPRSIFYIQRDLELYLPKDFPNFSITTANKSLTLFTDTDLSIEYRELVSNIFNSFRTPLTEIRFLVQKIDPKSERDENLIIATTRSLRGSISDSVLNLYERDEQFWLDNRIELLTSSEESEKYSFNTQNKSRCVVDSTALLPRNLRTYFSIYETVVLALPVAERYEDALNSLKISEDELIELVRIGKIEPILQQNPNRYSKSLLEKLAELDCPSILLPRKLLSFVIKDGRSRHPVLFPTFNVSERREILKALYQEIHELPNDPERAILSAILEASADNWANWENDASLGGIIGTARTGLANLGNKLYKAVSGRDAQLELIDTARMIEWAGAFRATAFPFVSADYDGKGTGYANEKAASFLASIYTGIPEHAKNINHVGKIDYAIQSILSISSDEPIFSFVDSLGGGDIERFRDLINRIATQAVDKEEIAIIAESYNKEVKRYATLTKNLDTFDIMGLTDFVLGFFDIIPSYYISGSSIIWNILNKRFDSSKSQMPVLGAIFDALNGILRSTSPHAVLINRMRQRGK